MSPVKLFSALFVALSITIIFTNQVALAQGPGGVNTNLEAWYDAGTGVTTAGGSVSNWADQSGNGNDATQATAVNQPTNPGGVLNGQPVVRFDGTNDQLALSRVVQDDFSIIAVFSTIQNFGSSANWYQGAGLVDAEVPGVTNDFGMSMGGGNIATGIGNPDTTVASAGAYNDGVGHIATFRRSTGADQIAQFVDGASQGTSNAGGTQSLNVPTRIVLGSLQTNINYFNGDIAEAIIYSTPLIESRRTIVENYLSSKYNAGLNTIGGANDVYAGDTPGNGNYDFDVAGIGQESDGSHTAASSGGFSATDAGYLQDDGDYLMFGNDATTNANVTSDLPASGVDSRWARIFYLDKTDINSNGGNAQLTFDFSDSGLGGTPDGTSTYSLLYRAGTSGTFSVVSTAFSISGDQVSFTEDVGGLSDGFYTLGVQAAPPVAIGGLTTFIEDEAGFGIMPSAALPLVGGLGMVLAAGGVGLWLVYRRKR